MVALFPPSDTSTARRKSKVKSQENKAFNKIADGQLISAPPVLEWLTL